MHKEKGFGITIVSDLLVSGSFIVHMHVVEVKLANMDMPSVTLLQSTYSMAKSLEISSHPPIIVMCLTLIVLMISILTSLKMVSLVSESGNTKDYFKLPTDENLLNQIKSGFEEGKDLVVCAMGEEQICALKDIGPKN
ncbi:UNVERIFIED_CONTAM: Eukaryotic translation initiation factor 5A [Sesamum calycinum]|uniref:Eukaryotic translation initiation factor 5A n=1 Tax=Sesamum calycinum TaxID=2727403 RepID=A0AAW2Q6J7_9LAMI